MRKLIIPFAFFIAFVAAIAGAQTLTPYPQTLPPFTVVGRYAPNPGPAEAIPFSVLVAQLQAAGAAGVTGPGPTTFGHLPLWGNTTGSALVDFAAGTPGQLLQQSAGAAPQWTTATFPTTTTINQLLYSSAANAVAGLATANGGVLNTSAAGVPSVTATPTIGVPTSVLGTIDFAGNTSGTTKLRPQAVATGTVTLPAATDTLVGQATADTLTNKTISAGIFTGLGNVQGAWRYSTQSTPAQITANQNDYNPSAVVCASTTTLLVNSDVARDITGLAGGVAGCVMYLVNNGTPTITLRNESVSSAAGSRFSLGADFALAANQSIALLYDGVASRWRQVGGPSGAAGGAGAKQADQQVFTASGTWNKPGGFGAKAYTLIQCWGAGGGASRDATASNQTGGAGGAYKQNYFLLSSLGATETVTVGTAGAAATVSGNQGSAGGNSTFGSWLTAFGGGGGLIGGTGALGGSTTLNAAWNGFTDSGGAANKGVILYEGGRGAGSGLLQIAGGGVYGGGGGGSQANTAGNGSEFGGAGSNAAASPSAGTQPGGGGGSSTTAGTTGAAGGAGKCIATTSDGA